MTTRQSKNVRKMSAKAGSVRSEAKKEKSFNPIMDFYVFLGFSKDLSQILFYITLTVILYLFIGFLAGDWV